MEDTFDSIFELARGIFPGKEIVVTQAGAGLHIVLNDTDTLSIQMGNENDCENRFTLDAATADFILDHWDSDTTVGKLLRRNTTTAEVGFLRGNDVRDTRGHQTFGEVANIMLVVRKNGIDGYLPAPVMEDE